FGGEPALQGDRRVPAHVRRAGGEVGPGHQRSPAHGVQPLLRKAALGSRRKEDVAPGDLDKGPQPPHPRRVAGRFCAPMNRLIRAVDQISYWSGKTFAWLIVALTLVVSVE